jgi:hypothetical protein
MFADVFDKLFGCWHKNYSFPITAKKGNGAQCEAARITGTYVVCLDCGREFPYDWKQMKVLPTGSEVAEAELAESAAPLPAGRDRSFVKAA